MATKYFALLTNVGAANLAKATALGEKIEITQMAVGDGNGALPTPSPAQTALNNERRRAPLNMLTVDPVNTNQIIAEQVIPEDAGGWWIREIGLFDKDGDMVAIANCAETYKPQLQEGSGRVQVIRVILIVSSTESVTLKIDPSVVLATRKYVEDKVIEIRLYVDQKLEEHLATVDPHPQYIKTAEIDKYIPVGIPLPWPQAIPPSGWLKCNGATFDKSKYPLLATVYPNGMLPDLRGEFIRGWDDAKGVDVGRQLLSNQADAIRNIKGQIIAYTQGQTTNTVVLPVGVSGALATYNSGNNSSVIPVAQSTLPVTNYGVMFDASLVVPTASENRPRNIAFNYIVRAA